VKEITKEEEAPKVDEPKVDVDGIYEEGLLEGRREGENFANSRFDEGKAHGFKEGHASGIKQGREEGYKESRQRHQEEIIQLQSKLKDSKPQQADFSQFI
jgi:flagellar biosynthesis/type III secretory pathway protein FliH